METKAFYDNRFDAIQALRGITCLLILSEHVRFLNCGAFGVDIFFCISGFMIMLSTHKGRDHFITKRLIRIVPLYSLMTLGTFILLLVFPGLFAQTKASPTYLWKSLLYIPFDIGDGVIQPLLRIGWTVNCEMFFYLLFYLAMLINHKYRSVIAGLLLVILVAVGQIFSFQNPVLCFYTDPVMLDFALGIMLYGLAVKLYSFKEHKSISPVLGIACMTIACILILLLAVTKHRINILGMNRLLLWSLPCAVIVFCFFVTGLLFRFPKWLVQIGNISFSVYLMHYYPIQFLDRKIFDFGTLTPLSFIGVVIGIFISLLAGYLSWYLMEQKFTNFLKKKLMSSHH